MMVLNPTSETHFVALLSTIHRQQEQEQQQQPPPPPQPQPHVEKDKYIDTQETYDQLAM